MIEQLKALAREWVVKLESEAGEWTLTLSGAGHFDRVYQNETPEAAVARAHAGEPADWTE